MKSYKVLQAFRNKLDTKKKGYPFYPLVNAGGSIELDEKNDFTKKLLEKKYIKESELAKETKAETAKKVEKK